MSQAQAAAAPASQRRRKALIGVGGMAALLVLGEAFRRRAALTDSGRDGVVVHSRPRELPPLRFGDATGAVSSLAAYRGRAVVLNVWATWCAPCREEMPALDRLQAALGGPDFEVVTVSIDASGLKAVQPFFRQLRIEHLHPYLDRFGEAAAWVAAGIPLTLLIDRDGREAGRKLGTARWDAPDMLALIRRLLSMGAT